MSARNLSFDYKKIPGYTELSKAGKQRARRKFLRLCNATPEQEKLRKKKSRKAKYLREQQNRITNPKIVAFQENNKCIICWEVLYRPMKLNCNHLLCELCLHTHLLTAIADPEIFSYRCPMCRTLITEVPIPCSNMWTGILLECLHFWPKQFVRTHIKLNKKHWNAHVKKNSGKINWMTILKINWTFVFIADFKKCNTWFDDDVDELPIVRIDAEVLRTLNAKLRGMRLVVPDIKYDYEFPFRAEMLDPFYYLPIVNAISTFTNDMHANSEYGNVSATLYLPTEAATFLSTAEPPVGLNNVTVLDHQFPTPTTSVDPLVRPFDDFTNSVTRTASVVLNSVSSQSPQSTSETVPNSVPPLAMADGGTPINIYVENDRYKISIVSISIAFIFIDVIIFKNDEGFSSLIRDIVETIRSERQQFGPHNASLCITFNASCVSALQMKYALIDVQQQLVLHDTYVSALSLRENGSTAPLLPHETAAIYSGTLTGSRVPRTTPLTQRVPPVLEESDDEPDVYINPVDFPTLAEAAERFLSDIRQSTESTSSSSSSLSETSQLVESTRNLQISSQQTPARTENTLSSEEVPSRMDALD